MGINSSKISQKVPESEIVPANPNLEQQGHEYPETATIEDQGSIPSTPILTPKIARENIEKEYLDPRSPSKHIARTPIDLIPADVENLKSLTIGSHENNEPMETPIKKQILLGIDPRSPSLEFQRTPIVVSASPDKKFPEKLRNKNLDKVLKCALPKGKITPPKLLGSCPVTPKPKSSDAYKRKSLVLLETNVDFTETDLDNVLKEKYLGKSLQNLYPLEEPSYSEITDPRSPTTYFLRTPIQVCQQVKEANINVESIEQPLVQNEDRVADIKFKEEKNIIPNEETTLKMENFSPIIPVNTDDCDVENISILQINGENYTELELQDSYKFEKETEQHSISAAEIIANEPFLDEPIYVPETKETITVTPPKKSSPKQKLVISPILKHEFQVPKSAPVSPPSIISVTPKKCKSQPVTPPFIDLTADVKELDKKLTHLIYEDEKDLVVCPRVVRVKDQSRTPLGLRNGTETKKSTQKLKVSDKPRKAEYAVSKIPVFKEKKIKVQCENTPPRGMNMRPKKSRWDAKDDTLVI